MSRVLGRLWGHQGRLWECLGVAGVTPESSRASKLAPRASKLTPWGVQVGSKSVSVGSKSVQVHPRLFQEGAKGEPDRPTVDRRPPAARPSDRRPPVRRPTDYIYKLPINRFSGPILVLRSSSSSSLREFASHTSVLLTRACKEVRDATSDPNSR